MKRIKLVFFDVCDTLYDENTTFGFLEYYFPIGRKALLLKIRKLYIVKAFNYLFVKLFGYDFVRLMGISMLKNESKKDLEIYAKQYVIDRLEYKKNKEIHTLLDRYKEEKREIVLLSGSLDFIIKAIADELQIDHYYASALHYINSVSAGKIDIDLLGRKSFIVEKNFYGQRYIVVTDNLSDLNIVKGSQKSYILSKEKNISMWNTLNNIEIIKILE